MSVSDDKLLQVERAMEKSSALIRSAIRKTCPFIDRFDLEDIEQEVRISLWKEIHKGEKEIRNLGSYIWRVAYTTTCKIMKRLTEQRKALAGLKESDPDKSYRFLAREAEGPECRYQNKELQGIIREAVDSLLESRKQAVELYLSGLRVEEITTFFGWPEGKARNLVSRGLAELRLRLREKGFEFEGQESGEKDSESSKAQNLDAEEFSKRGGSN